MSSGAATSGDAGGDRAARHAQSVRVYFEACNEASREKFEEVLTEDAVHYFPPKVGGPFYGRDAIIELWATFVREKDSRWTIDRLVADDREAAVEWTHFKPNDGEHIRGAEWYEFDQSGKIREIRAYYASPRDPSLKTNELEGFPYARKGFALDPPRDVPGRD